MTVPKPAGVFRIACVGGSTTVEGPHNELTYPNYLERMLGARFPLAPAADARRALEGRRTPGKVLLIPGD